jgi:hypothetical protein
MEKEAIDEQFALFGGYFVALTIDPSPYLKRQEAALGNARPHNTAKKAPKQRPSTLPL